MLFQTIGKRLLGFTKEFKCSNCNQLTPHLVREEYTEQKALFIPMPTVHGTISMLCPICEKEESLTRWIDLWGHNDRKKSIVEVLEEGKDYTKQWLSKQDHKSKETVFKRLNALKAHALVKYLAE